MTKAEIINALRLSFSNFTKLCSSIDQNIFFDKPTAKWSVAENVKHLAIATNTSALAFTLPKFLVRWVGGKPNRGSSTYEELVIKYKKKLEDGGTASGRFVPKPLPITITKEKMMDEWENAASKFIVALEQNRTEKDLDNYLVKHPLLGRITLRELCYFTIFHTQHHQNSIAVKNAAQ